jgi:putative heme-binding domain-containing protein
MPKDDGTPPRPNYLRNVASNDVSGAIGDVHAQQMDLVYALRTIKNGWTSAQKARLIDWFAQTPKWRGGIGGTLNNLWNSSMQLLSEDERKAAAEKVPTLGSQPQRAAGPWAQPGAGRGGPAGLPGGPPQAAAAGTPQAPAAGRGAGPAGGPGGGGGGRGRGAASPKEEILGNLLGNPGRGNAGAPNVENGKQVFTTLCAACHRFGDAGNDVGPDLTDVRSRFTRRAILESIFFPSDVVDDRFALWTFQLRGGDSKAGLIASEDDRTVMLKSGTEAPVTIQKSQIVTRKKSDTSLMPDLTEGLSTQQLRDVVAFLQAGGR